jgi:hypothetical protein
MLRRLCWLALVVTGAACQPAVPPATPTIAPTATPGAASAKPTVSSSPVSPTSAVPVTSGRVDVLRSADAAYQRGSMADAAQLYERVVNTPPAAAEPPLIDQYAHFRAMLALLAAGDEAQARTHLEALQSRDASAALARMAAQVWDQYSQTGQLKAACAQLQSQSAAQVTQVVSALAPLGLTVSATTLCPAT